MAMHRPFDRFRILFRMMMNVATWAGAQIIVTSGRFDVPEPPKRPMITPTIAASNAIAGAGTSGVQRSPRRCRHAGCGGFSSAVSSAVTAWFRHLTHLCT